MALGGAGDDRSEEKKVKETRLSSVCWIVFCLLDCCLFVGLSEKKVKETRRARIVFYWFHNSKPFRGQEIESKQL